MLAFTLKTREGLVVPFHSCIIMFVEGNCCLVVNVSFVDNAVTIMIEYPVCCILGFCGVGSTIYSKYIIFNVRILRNVTVELSPIYLRVNFSVRL